MEKMKRKINFIDILVAVLLVAAAVAVFFFFSGKEAKGATDTEQAHFTLEVTGIPEVLKDAPKVGDTVSEKKTLSKIGVIEKVEAVPQEENVLNSLTGEYVKAAIPGRYKLYITCKGTATLASNKLVFGDFTMGVGTAVNIQSKHFASETVCIAIEKGE